MTRLAYLAGAATVAAGIAYAGWLFFRCEPKTLGKITADNDPDVGTVDTYFALLESMGPDAVLRERMRRYRRDLVKNDAGAA